MKKKQNLRTNFLNNMTHTINRQNYSTSDFILIYIARELNNDCLS